MYVRVCACKIASTLFDGNWEGTIRRTQSNMHWCVDVSWSNVIPYTLHHLLTNTRAHIFICHIFSLSLCGLRLLRSSSMYLCINWLQNINPISCEYACLCAVSYTNWRSVTIRQWQQWPVNHTYAHAYNTYTLFVSITSIHVNLDFVRLSSLSLLVSLFSFNRHSYMVH